MLWLWKEPFVCVIRPLRRNVQHKVISKLNKQPIRSMRLCRKRVMKLVQRFSSRWTTPIFRPKRHQKHTLWGGSYLCVIWGSTAAPPPPHPPPLSPGIVFTVGYEEMIYSPYFVARSERHFITLIRMNFMIYNRNYAQHTRQRVIWKTLKYPHDKEDWVQTHPTKWANSIFTRARFLKGRLALIQG